MTTLQAKEFNKKFRCIRCIINKWQQQQYLALHHFSREINFIFYIFSLSSFAHIDNKKYIFDE
jgi:hypothetical protein